MSETDKVLAKFHSLAKDLDPGTVNIKALENTQAGWKWRKWNLMLAVLLVAFFITNSSIAISMYNKYADDLTAEEKKNIGNSPSQMITAIVVFLSLGIFVSLSLLLAAALLSRGQKISTALLEK